MSDQSRMARMVHYTGQVQGVGFRYTASSIARWYHVAGWVRNLTDGRVELFIEGSQTDVDVFLKRVRDHWGKKIAKEQIEEGTPDGAIGFEIRK